MATVSPSLSNKMILIRVNETEHNLQFEKFVYDLETIYPGMFVRPFGPVGAYEDRKYQHMGDATAGDGWRPRMIAVENIYYGKTIDDPYEENERTHIRVLRSGDVVLSKISAGNLGEILEGDPYTYDANGWLRFWDSTADAAFAPVATPIETDPSPAFPRWTAVKIV